MSRFLIKIDENGHESRSERFLWKCFDGLCFTVIVAAFGISAYAVYCIIYPN